MTRDAGHKRAAREKKIRKRLKVIQDGGYQAGTVYEKHIAKIEQSSGYLSKHGSLLHYGMGTEPQSIKTRDKKRYGRPEDWSHRDRKRTLDLE